METAASLRESMDALLLVDLQYDFMPGGALAVPEGDEIVPLANRLARQVELVVASQDWHPADHRSFASQHAGKKPGDVIDLEGLQQHLWPDHCVQRSHGAELHEDLDQSRIERVFRKGEDPGIDSYSAFFDNAHRRATGLGNFLKEKGVTKIFVMGLATDYCVKFSALDAIGLGFQVSVVGDGCRGIDVKPGDVDNAIQKMLSKGATLTDSRRLLDEQSRAR
jgi:nicotinamidase/pyrazinamidase